MAYKPRIETNNVKLSSFIDTINNLPEASKGVSLDVITASSLPATVVENQIVVITDTTPGTIYVDTDEPANPVSGDVWVQVGSSDYGVEFSETFRNGLTRAALYNGTSWLFLSGYIGVSGVWEQFAFGLPAIGTPLANLTWKEIIILANSGEDVTQYFAVGDEKNLVLTTGEVIPVVIGGFYHNTITGTDKKAAIAFSFKNCLNTTYTMNAGSISTNAGGWNDSKMRTQTIPAILDTFPAELRGSDAIKCVDVVAAPGQTGNLLTSSDRLRLHSYTELGLTMQHAKIEGNTYAYYASGNRIKTVNGKADLYWTRSAISLNSTDFGLVSSSGETDYWRANVAFGVALAFDI